jgi:hypothetical protein
MISKGSIEAWERRRLACIERVQPRMFIATGLVKGLVEILRG